MINGVEYGWEDVTLTVLGRPLERILDFEYGVEEDKKKIYGRGKKVKGIQGGNEAPFISLTVGQSEFEAMVRIAQKTNPLAKIQSLRFDVQVHYLSGGDLIKDRVVGVQVKKYSKPFKQGDGDMQIKLECECEDVLHNL